MASEGAQVNFVEHPQEGEGGREGNSERASALSFLSFLPSSALLTSHFISKTCDSGQKHYLPAEVCRESCFLMGKSESILERAEFCLLPENLV